MEPPTVTGKHGLNIKSTDLRPKRSLASLTPPSRASAWCSRCTESGVWPMTLPIYVTAILEERRHNHGHLMANEVEIGTISTTIAVLTFESP